jgi:agmatinase
MTTFLDLPREHVDRLEVGAARVAILGIPHGVAYPDPGLTVGCADAPNAIRRRSGRVAQFADHHDFDLDGPMIPPGAAFRVVDVGDVEGSAGDGAGNQQRAAAAIRSLLDAGAVPIVLGGDDSVPIPVLRAYAGWGPMWVVQADAHLDFRDQVDGVRDGYSSTMRRASELGHVEGIVQVGLRGVGSARESDVADARAAGNRLITARELRQRGPGWVVEQVPAGASVFIAFDCDALDPSIMPAVSGLSPGGLTYEAAADLLAGLASRCRIAGASFTELVPALDTSGAAALVVVRLAMRLIAGIARR